MSLSLEQLKRNQAYALKALKLQCLIENYISDKASDILDGERKMNLDATIETLTDLHAKCMTSMGKTMEVDVEQTICALLLEHSAFTEKYEQFISFLKERSNVTNMRLILLNRKRTLFFNRENTDEVDEQLRICKETLTRMENQRILFVDDVSQTQETQETQKMPQLKNWHFVDKIIQIGTPSTHQIFDTDKILHIQRDAKTFAQSTLRHIYAIEMAILNEWNTCLIVDDFADWINFPTNYPALMPTFEGSWNIILLNDIPVYPNSYFKKLCTCCRVVKYSEYPYRSSYLIRKQYYKTLLNNLKDSLTMMKETHSSCFIFNQYWKKLQIEDGWKSVEL